MKPSKHSDRHFCRNGFSTIPFFSLRVRGHFRGAIEILGLVGLILCLACSSLAQVDRAGLNGTVTDSSGRVLPQTHITAVQDATGLRRETTSSAGRSAASP